MTDVGSLLQSALRAHQTGDRAAAERLYLRVLELDPRSIDALQLLGVVCHQGGRGEAAIEYFRRALAIHPAFAEAHFNLGVTLRELGRIDDAIVSFRRAVAVKPSMREAQFNLGNALRDKKQLHDAVTAYRAAISVEPNYFKALANLGRTLLDLEKFGDAIPILRRAAELQPQNAAVQENLRVATQQNQLAALKPFQGSAAMLSGIQLQLRETESFTECRSLAARAVELGDWEAAASHLIDALVIDSEHVTTQIDLGTVLRRLNRFADAKAMFDHVLKNDPQNVFAWNGLGAICRDERDLEQAVTLYRKALAIDSRNADSNRQLGWTLVDLDRLDEALQCFAVAEESEPNSARLQHAIGNALAEAGRDDEAIVRYQQGLQYDPSFAGNRLGWAMCSLAAGDFAFGWQNYEARWECPWVKCRRMDQPLWRGEPRPGQTILLYAEQGLGDTLQFIRYAPLVRQRSGAHVIIEVDAKLIPLLRHSPGCEHLIAAGAGPPPCDARAPLMSLPWIFGTTLESVPNQMPYLFPDAARLAKWQQQLQAIDGFKVGIAWQGSPTHRRDRARSVALEAFEPLAKIPGVQLISLQRGFGVEQIGKVANRFTVHRFGDEIDAEGAFVDTAAIMSNLDLVISTDTAIPHLSGALGVTTWLVLSHVPEWRWLRHRTDSPWYPSLRLFRQPTHGAWNEVFATAARELADFVAKKATAATSS